MDGRLRFADSGILEPVVRAALGVYRKVTAVERLSGGPEKRAHRVVVDKGMTAILYARNPTESTGIYGRLPLRHS